MFRRPLVAFTICWVAGSAAAASLGGRGAALAGAALAAWLLALAASRLLPLRMAAVCMAAYAVAAGQRAWTDARNVTALADLAEAAASGGRAPMVVAAGTIVSAVDIDGDRVSFRADLATVRVQGAAPRGLRERVQVQVRLAERPELQTAARWKRGDRLRLSGMLERPAQATNFGGFNYRRYLYGQRIHWLLKADGAKSVAIAGRERLSTAALLRPFDAVRARLGAGMDVLFPVEQSGYMKGLVLGVRADIDPELFRQFSQLGLTHILAISGLHVAVFLFGLGGLLRFMRLSREAVYELLCFAVPVYVLLSGASPSVVRAGVMAVLGLTAARFNRLKDGLHVLCAAALFMLIWNPYYLTDVSFQLSFAVTAGLILGVPPVRRMLPRPKRGGALLDLIAVSAVAQAVSFPLSIYYFNQFHLLSLPANIVLVPFISFIVMPVGAAALFVSYAWLPAGKLLAFGADAANAATFAFTDWLSRTESLRTIWPSPPVWWIIAWYAGLGILLRLLPALPLEQQNPGTDNPKNPAGDTETQPLGSQSRPNSPPHVQPCSLYTLPDRVHASDSGWRGLLKPIMATAALAGLLIYAYAPDRFDRSGRVQFLDVGQGDAIHIRTPGGKQLIIDGGGAIRYRKPDEAWRERRDPFEVGRKTVVPLLLKRGVHAIDLLVVTHLDADHIGGLKEVLRSIPVKAILWNGTLKPGAESKNLLREAARRKIPVIAADSALPVYRPDADTSLRILWPRPAAPARTGGLPVLEKQNDLSVAVQLTMYERTFVLAGDMGSTTERSILESFPDTSMLDSGDDDESGRSAVDGRRPPSSAYPAVADAADVAVTAPIDVLKLSHHGSKNSSSAEWLSYWRPLEAAVSVGRNNFYGHPNPDTLQRAARIGATVRRTDEDGEIQYDVGRGYLRVRTKITRPQRASGNKAMIQR